MTDRELLELAAKAAGINANARWSEVTRTWLGDEETTNEFWNPLTDDGDALRLAVRCKVDLVFVTFLYGPAEVVFVGADEEKYNLSDYPYADVRRAIVRAAAEIGRNMK